MSFCRGKTKNGRRCCNQVPSGQEYCEIHEEYESSQTLKVVSLGGLAGALLIPGMQGVAVGAVASFVIKKLIGPSTGNKKVFISFDFNNDRRLKDLVVLQSKLENSPFSIVDHSLIEAKPESTWKRKLELP